MSLSECSSAAESIQKPTLPSLQRLQQSTVKNCSLPYFANLCRDGQSRRTHLTSNHYIMRFTGVESLMKRPGWGCSSSSMPPCFQRYILLHWHILRAQVGVHHAFGLPSKVQAVIQVEDPLLAEEDPAQCCQAQGRHPHMQVGVSSEHFLEWEMSSLNHQCNAVVPAGDSTAQNIKIQLVEMRCKVLRIGLG